VWNSCLFAPQLACPLGTVKWILLATAVQEIRAEEKTSATIIDVILKHNALRN